jgi:hypothetical protein
MAEIEGAAKEEICGADNKLGDASGNDIEISVLGLAVTAWPPQG